MSFASKRKAYSRDLEPVSNGQKGEKQSIDNTCVHQTCKELEEKVKQRTSDLHRTVEVLQGEVRERIASEKALLEKSRILDAFFRYSVTPLVFLDQQFNFIRVNEAYAKACHRKASEFPGHNHFEFYPHSENQKIFEDVVRTRKHYQAIAKPFSFPNYPEWGVTYWDWTLAPILDDNGNVEMLIFSLRDVTARVCAEQKIRESENKYRELVESANSIIMRRDIEGKITFFNEFAQKFFGYSEEEILGQNIIGTIIPEFDTHGRNMRQLVKDIAVNPDKYRDNENENILRNGKHVWISWTNKPVLDKSGNIIEILAVGNDITRLKETQDSLHKSHKQLRSLTAELLMAEERERRRIAEQLHDSVGQILAFSKIELGNITRDNPPQKLAEKISRMRNLINDAIKQTRTLTFDISPPALYTLGFEPAVEELLEHFAGDKKFDYIFDNTEEDKPLADHIKILLYRSIRELLINVVKHSQADLVKVALSTADDNIHVLIEDNGSGFEVSSIPQRIENLKGFGLFSIQERLTHAGGAFNICSDHGKGTTVKLQAPLKIRKGDKHEHSNYINR